MKEDLVSGAASGVTGFIRSCEFRLPLIVAPTSRISSCARCHLPEGGCGPCRTGVRIILAAIFGGKSVLLALAGGGAGILLAESATGGIAALGRKRSPPQRHILEPLRAPVYPQDGAADQRCLRFGARRARCAFERKRNAKGRYCSLGAAEQCRLRDLLVALRCGPAAILAVAAGHHDSQRRLLYNSDPGFAPVI